MVTLPYRYVPLSVVLLLLASKHAVAVVAVATMPVWEELAQQGDVPPPLWNAGGFSFAKQPAKSASNMLGIVEDSDSTEDIDHSTTTIYRFGGQVGNFPNDTVLNDFYALDLDTLTWTNLTLRSPRTSARNEDSHSEDSERESEGPAARTDAMLMPGPCGNCVSVVGGRGPFRTGQDKMFPDMWTYQTSIEDTSTDNDSDKYEWKLVEGDELGNTTTLLRSSALIVPTPDGKVYLFGGVGNTLPSFPTTPTGLRNDVAMYEPNQGWISVATTGSTTGGDVPSPRGWPTGTYNPSDDSILLFGGYILGPNQGPDTPPFELFGETNYENDLWSLNLDTLEWTELLPSGVLPEPRDNVVSFFDASRNGFVIYGGQVPSVGGIASDIWFYSLMDNSWTKVADYSDMIRGPPPRIGAVHVVRETSNAYELILQGGATSELGESQFLNDLWKLTWPKA